MDLTERKIQLENLGVHDLRNIGRMWGVPSPTLLKKEKLIDLILKVMSGQKTFTIKNKAGRPVKNKLMNRCFQQELLPKELREFAEERNKDSLYIDRYLPFAQSEESEFSSILERKDGYLVKHNQDYYFCTDDDDLVHVPNVLVAQYALIIGDFLTVFACSVNAKNYFVAREVEEINKKPAGARNLCSMKDIVLNNNSEGIGNIKEGSKSHIYHSGKLDFIEKNVDLLNEFIKNNYKLFVVGVGLPADGLIKIKKYIKNCLDFVSYYENEPLYAYEAVNNAINHATVLARTGEKILIIVLNIENIYTELDLFFLAKGERRDIHTYSTIKLLRKLIGLNRCLSNGGSITIVTVTADREFELMRY
ncbi:MAG: hypothetical protein PHX09_00395 [Clostridia bacterium]|nr:hypothetical protein [Clostridia bacterium]MDD4686121.1 hypothetical protein [Clostridia bacterium]